MPRRPDRVELDFLDAGPFGLPNVYKNRRSARWKKQLGSLSANRLILFVSFALFVVLSWYFYVPSTLYLYISVVCAACPLLFASALYTSSHSRDRRGRTITLGVVTCFVMLCFLRGWTPRHLTIPTTWNTPNSNETYFIVSLLRDSEKILPQYTQSILSFAQDVGPQNVFVSIFENDSRDRTPIMLKDFRSKLLSRGIPHHINSTQLPSSIRSYERIRRLSTLRNFAMRPMYEEMRNGLQKRPFTKVVWINDVFFNKNMLHHLLHTANGTYDQVCALDYFWLGFYDTWVMRDRYGMTVRPLWPYFRRGQDRSGINALEPVPVNSCWNGMTVFDARWFLPASAPRTSIPNAQHPTSPVIVSVPPAPLVRDDGIDTPAKLPLEFRTCRSCNVSEALLTSLDMHRIAAPRRPRIYVNPAVKVAYDYPSYYLYNYLLRWYVVQPWRYVWETWMERRLFSWLADLGNRHDSCASLLNQMWTNEPVMT